MHLFCNHHYCPSSEFIIPRSPSCKAPCNHDPTFYFLSPSISLWPSIRSHTLSLLLYPIGQLYSQGCGYQKGGLTGALEEAGYRILYSLSQAWDLGILLHSSLFLPRPHPVSQQMLPLLLPPSLQSSSGPSFPLQCCSPWLISMTPPASPYSILWGGRFLFSFKMLFSDYRSNAYSLQNIWEMQNNRQKAIKIPRWLKLLLVRDLPGGPVVTTL